MKKLIGKLVVFVLLLPCVSWADPILVTYEIGSYETRGFSGSAVHRANRCRGEGPTSGHTLYMCGGGQRDIFGEIEGYLYDNGVLAVTGGLLNIGGSDYEVYYGGIGPFFDDGFGYSALHIERFGTFYFEHLVMGSGKPNYFDGETLILWGQNENAYYCKPRECRNRWGIDLYGHRVPEPGTLALFGAGLLGLVIFRRRNRFSAHPV